MTSDFQEAVHITLKNEGGFSDNREDHGGVTKYGISFRFLIDNGIDINKDGLINGKDIQDLTLDEAISIYKTQFWDKFNMGLIQNQKVADKVFDLSVNIGSYEAIKLLQESINEHLFLFGIKEDGILGPKTLQFLNGIDSNLVLGTYKDLACSFYEDLVKKNPTQKIFLKDWLERANQ